MSFTDTIRHTCDTCILIHFSYFQPSLESAVYVNSTSIASSAVGFGFLFLLLSDTRVKKIIVMGMC